MMVRTFSGSRLEPAEYESDNPGQCECCGTEIDLDTDGTMCLDCRELEETESAEEEETA
jgi:hypothetical protein